MWPNQIIDTLMMTNRKEKITPKTVTVPCPFGPFVDIMDFYISLYIFHVYGAIQISFLTWSNVATHVFIF